MSMSQTSIQGSYLQQIEALPPEAFLGSLVFFSISQADVELDDARAELTRLGLPLDGLRKNLRPTDAYRKASAAMARKFKEVDGVRAELLVRSLGEDAEQAYRQLILERVSTKEGRKRRVFYEKVASVTWNRGTRGSNGEYLGHSVESERTTHLLGSPLTAEEDEWLTVALRTFPDNYERMLTHLDTHAVRSYVRETIYDHLGGTCVKGSGGLYFVKQDHADIVARLGEWVRGVGSEFHSLPLLNLQDQREMILAAFEEETLEDVGKLQEEIARMIKAGTPILAKTYDQFVEKAVVHAARARDYGTAMGRRAERAEIQIHMLHAQAMQLAHQVRESQRKQV